MTQFANSTHVTPPERAAFQAFLDDGYVDVVRPHTPGPDVYTYWDYYRQRFERNRGLRIDFVLGSPSFAARVTGAFIDRDERDRRRAGLPVRPRAGRRRPRLTTSAPSLSRMERVCGVARCTPTRPPAGPRAADGALRLPGRGRAPCSGCSWPRWSSTGPTACWRGAARVKERGPPDRRRAARQHRRLPDLRVRADGAALGQRLPARRRLGRSGGRACRWSPPATSSAARDAKTDDHFFLGFPRYWNVVAFYVVVFELGPVATTAVLLVLSVLVFVPVKYVYPSRTETLWYTNMVLATAFLVLFGAITAPLPDVPVVLTGLSLGLPGLLRRHQPVADAAHREFGGRTGG